MKGLTSISLVRDSKAAFLRGLCGLAFVLIFGAASSVLAQSYLTASGEPTFAAPEPVELGFVESANGALHLELPLGSFPQRGTKQPLTLKMIYDSNIWRTNIVGLGTTWQPQNSFQPAGRANWRYIGGYFSMLWFMGTHSNNNCISDYDFFDDSGTDHYFAINVGNGAPGCPTTGTAYATDSSGLQLSITDRARVYAPDGTQVWIDGPWILDPDGHRIMAYDANGNYISRDNQSVTTPNVYDTLRRTLITEYQPVNGPCANPSFCYDVLNSQGTTSRFTATGIYIPVKTNFGQSGVTECNNGCTVSVLQSLTLPDSSSYTFLYDCDSSTGNPACGSPSGRAAYYGEIISVTLPTGGQISYTFTTITDAYNSKGRWTNTRTSAGGTWIYTPSVISTCSPSQVGCQQKMTVLRPSGDSTVYTFTLNNGAWPVQIQQYKANGALLSTTTNSWNFGNNCVLDSCIGAAFIQKTSETATVTIPGGSSLTKKTTYTYDTAGKGNITAVKEWKFYAGTSPTYPTTPDRATYVTYYSAGNNIINKPLSTTLCNNTGSDGDCPGGGSKVTQTKVTYDSYGSGLASANNMTHHDDTNYGSGKTVRGNPTQIQQWVSGTTFLPNTTYQYDIIGHVVKTTDPASNTTTYGYADSFFNDVGNNSPPQSYTAPQATNAYLTSVTLPSVNGVVMTATRGYYFGSGKLAESTDPNAAQTQSHFFDSLDRPTQTNFPVGWNLTTYPSFTEADTYVPVADTAASSSCTSCRQNQFLFDGWGRKATQAASNVGPLKVDTTYDSSGRVATVSHPYVNANDPSHVFETYTYDELNRKTAVTHPDGQSAVTAYGPDVITLGGVTTQQSSTSTYGYAYPTVAGDEAGKERQEWVDGFGKIIEVDEPSTNSGTPGSTSISINTGPGQLSMIWDPCYQSGHGSCPQTIYNGGTISVTINGSTANASWGPGFTTQGIASALATSFPPGSAVRTTANGSSVTITAAFVGASTNFSFTTSDSYNTTMCGSSTCFSGPAFSPSPSSGALTGGTGGISSSPLVTAYTYDAAGRLKGVAQGVQTRAFAYDGLGRPTSITTPEAGTDTLTYDSNSSCSTPNNFPGHLISKVDARGIRTCFQYDTLGRLTNKNYSNGQGAVTYQYDQGGAGAFALGRLTKMTDPSGSETYTYDTQGGGRITQIQKVIGSTTYTTGYGYNTGGQITQITYPSGRSVTQTLDNIGRLSSVADTKSGTNTTRASSYNYNNAQQVLNFTYGNGVLATFGYSAATREQMTSLRYANGSQTLFSLGYYYQNDPINCTTGTAGNDGEVNCINDGVDSGRTVTYTYDALGRALTALTHGSTGYAQWGLSWNYDRYGNRLTQTVTAGSGYSNTLSFGNPGGAQTNHPDGMCFDNSGNMTAESGTCPPASPMYSYDAENRLTAYSGSSSAASYVYDDNGRRVKKCLPNCISPTTTTVYVFSAGQDIAEYDNGAAPTSPSREYIYSGSRLLTTLAGSTTTYHHADHLSVRLSTDTNGNKIGEQGHYPYGETWYTANTTTKFVFTSYERDSESNNDYAMARYYRVGFGRFVSPDPKTGNAGDPQSWNRYVYAGDNPVSNVDPSGMSWLSPFFKALVNFFTGALFPGMPPTIVPTFPTPADSQSLWDKLATDIIPPMRGGIIMNVTAVPDPTDPGVQDLVGSRPGEVNCSDGMPCIMWDDSANMWVSPDVPVNDQTMLVAQEVTLETAAFSNLVNCAAAATYPFVSVAADAMGAPAISLDALDDGIDGIPGVAGDAAQDATGDIVDNQADKLAEQADKLKKWKMRSVPTRRASNLFKFGGKLLQAYSIVNAADQAQKNLHGCTAYNAGSTR